MTHDLSHVSTLESHPLRSIHSKPAWISQTCFGLFRHEYAHEPTGCGHRRSASDDQNFTMWILMGRLIRGHRAGRMPKRPVMPTSNMLPNCSERTLSLRRSLQSSVLVITWAHRSPFRPTGNERRKFRGYWAGRRPRKSTSMWSGQAVEQRPLLPKDVAHRAGLPGNS